MNLKKIWLVFGPGRGPASKPHDDKEGATREAQRLAELHKGVPFHVCESIGAYVVDAPAMWTSFDEKETNGE